MKQYEVNQPAQEYIDGLVESARNAPDESTRSRAMRLLWRVVGDTIMGNMVGKSYRMQSDFGMRGYSPKHRQANLSSDGYIVFYKAVMNYDKSLGVPFGAYVAQKIGWQLANDKRDNSKREKRVILSSKMQANDSGVSTEDPFAVLLERIPSKEDVEGDCFRKDAILKIKRVAAGAPRLFEYFEACQELCNQGFRGSDAEVARYMGCTRASTGTYRKKLVRLLAEHGLDFATLYTPSAV